MSPREGCTKKEVHTKDMQNILSIESCKGSQEKTNAQAFREGKLHQTFKNKEAHRPYAELTLSKKTNRYKSTSDKKRKTSKTEMIFNRS